MKNKKKMICDEFDKEVFLFHEGSLSRDRMELIEYHLGICKSCLSIYKDFEDLIAAYENFPKEDIDPNKFNYMVRKATTPEIRPGKYVQKRKSFVEVFGFYRLGFGGAAVVAAMILIIISILKNPSVENKLPSELLDWNGDKITSKIEKIENQIISLRSEEWDIYIVRKNEKANWDATLKNIRSQINKLKEATKNREL